MLALVFMNKHHYLLAKLAANQIWHVTLDKFVHVIRALELTNNFKELCQQEPQLKILVNAFGESRISAIFAQGEREWSLGLRFIYPGHQHYPEEFCWLERPPFFIQYRGAPVWMDGRRGLAIVGTRDPSEQSLQWLDLQMAEICQQIPFTVSGGARGIDFKVHRASLCHRLPTVVVVPSGLLALYPKALEQWQDDVVQSGGVFVSEYESWQGMRKHHFQARNRLIAALGACTLVIEAARKSGTMLTARFTLEQGKPVLVLPTHPSQVRGRGGLDLLCDGAVPIRDAQDVCMHYHAESAFRASRSSGLGSEGNLGVDHPKK